MRQPPQVGTNAHSLMAAWQQLNDVLEVIKVSFRNRRLNCLVKRGESEMLTVDADTSAVSCNIMLYKLTQQIGNLQ